VYGFCVAKSRVVKWDARSVRGLRRHLDITQSELAAEIGVRQQTVSEWETGAYRPRGASEKLLGMVADKAGFQYRARRDQDS
jgi:DNA-binding transcriptional regulator YiaG